MNTTVDTTLIEAARQIVPVVREHSEEAERERRLSRPVLDALFEAGLLRMATPRSLGGLEVDPVTCARVIEIISGADSAAGWTLVNPSNYAFLCARLPDAGAEEIFASDPNALIAGPFHPPLKGTPVDGGYRISGRNPFGSNCYDANWMAVTATVMDDDQPRTDENGNPEVILAIVPADQCKIIDTWYVLGMRGTGSHDIELIDVFVPTTRTFPMVPEFEPGSHYRGPLYSISLMGDLTATLPLVLLAMARNAIDEVSMLAQGKTPFGSSTLLRQRGTSQIRLAQAEAALRSARALLYNSLDEVWERALAGEPVSLEQRADLLLATANAASSSAKVVALMYNMAGTSGIYTRNPLERYFRDVQVLKQHGFASENRFETVGQVYFSLPPEWGPVML